jgi:transcription initiation factor TFIID subunit 10
MDDSTQSTQNNTSGTREEELDASIEADISQEPLQTDSMQIDSSANDTTQASIPANPASAEPRIPAKKDASLREFLGKMDDYAPIVSRSLLCATTYLCETNRTDTATHQIPDAVTNYYLTLAGLPPPPQTPIQLTRLLSLATQKFIADIAADAYQYARIRSSNTSSANPMGATGVAAVAGPGGAGPSGGAAGREGDKNKNLGVQRPGYGGGGQGGSGQGRTVLTMEDLGMAVGEYGVNVKRSEFYR